MNQPSIHQTSSHVTSGIHGFLALCRTVEKKTPELTLDQTVRLLQRAFEVPGLRLELAVKLVDYHIRRNEIARRSHGETWWAGHKGVKLQRE